MDGAFEIRQILAGGTFGVVCAASVRASGEEVALKILRRAHRGTPMVQRARDEARVLTRIRHPHIVAVEQLFHVHGRPVLVMERVDGVSLQRLLRAHRDGLPVGVALALVRDAAAALDAAWAWPDPDSGEPMHIIHRDLQPSNLMLTRDGVLKIIDFGIARGDYWDREAASTAVLKGALAYQAPERDVGQNDGPAGDVYALGVLLFELVSGRTLVVPRDPSTHPLRLAEQVAALPVDDLDADLATRLRALVTRMVDFHPKRRPDAAAVAIAVTDLIADLGLLDDLAAFAQERVPPLIDERPTLVREGTDWTDVADIERVPPDEQTSFSAPAPPTPTSHDAEVARFLAQAGWESRLKDLRRLLARSSGWSAAPFLALLADAQRPWWRFWRPGTPAAQVSAALDVLRGRATPEVRAAVSALVKHADPTIAAAAAAFLQPRPPVGR